MQVKDISFVKPFENILFDEVLFQLADKQGAGEFLRFWQSPHVFVVLGRIGKEHDDIWLERTAQDHVPVLRRTSGGGTVVQGPGCLNYTLVLNKDRHPDLNDLRKSYNWISAQIMASLSKCGIKAVFRPISDIALADSEKKISGNAQHRGKNFILHHGTILCDFDLNLIIRYLKMPQDVPEYRQKRSHEEFVANTGLKPDAFKAAMLEVFGAQMNEDSQVATSQELLALKELISTRPVMVDY
jgi:lipoate---protein ligase